MHHKQRLHTPTEECTEPQAAKAPVTREVEPAEYRPPCWQVWLAGGLLAICAGTWLLRADDPFLLSLWGVGLAIIGTALTIVGAGLGLRIWR